MWGEDLPCDGAGEDHGKGQKNEIIVNEQFLEGSNPSQESKAAADYGKCTTAPYQTLYSIRVYSDDLVARTYQKYGLLHFHDMETGSSWWSAHGVSSVSTKCASAVKTSVDLQLSSPYIGWLNSDNAEREEKELSERSKDVFHS